VRRVDGLPLAVELAAARIRVLPPHELLKRMELRLPMLSGGARDLPLRQQTMRDTIGWSYDLLDPRNRMLFRWLGVFAGGFTLDAAEALSADALDGITTLVEHSLLRQRAGPDGTPRYFMLETVREYARDRLEESGEQELAQQRHAGVYLALAERAAPMLTGAQQVEWLDRLERDHGNLRAALQWSLDQPDPAIATRLGAALWLFWRRRGFLSEGRLHLERILALPEHAETLANRCSMLTGAGALALFQGEYDAAIAFSEQAISGWRTIDGYQGVGRSLLCMAIVARHRDEYELADRLGQESLAAFQVIGPGAGSPWHARLGAGRP
jgi:predicted ATPase